MKQTTSKEVSKTNSKFAFSVTEACEALGITRPTLYKEIEAGRLQSYSVRRRRFISSRALLKYQRDREAEAAAEYGSVA